MEQEPILNAHNKEEYPPMHTAEKKTFLIRRGIVYLLLSLIATNASAQDRMFPSKVYANERLRGYETALFDYFNISKANKFACLVKPSYHGQYCLSYNQRDNLLILKRAKKNIWSEQGWTYPLDSQLRNPGKKVDAEEYSLRISDSLADSLQVMFASAILTSSLIGDTLGGLGGVTYQFMLSPRYSSWGAVCWSPKESTNCGQAVAIIEKLCKYVETGDKEAAENLIGEIVRVTNLFRQYYPAGYRHEKTFCI